MSSCPPIRCGSRHVRSAALLVLAALLTLVGAPVAVAQPPLRVVSGGPVDGQLRLIVQVPDGTAERLRPEAFTASVAGVPQPTRAVPVVSDRLAVALVVDASDDGSPGLPSGLGGAANFVLAAPPSARSALITDGTPPTVAVPWPSGPADTLRGLSAVRPGGARDTAAALDLAVAQLPAGATDPRLVVLHTGAPDAGGERAPAIIERLRAAGVVLAVVGPDSKFWTTVAAGTGGVATPADPRDVIGAFDRIVSALDRSYLVTIPAPGRSPATVVVRAETGSGPLVGEVATSVAPEYGGPGLFAAVLLAGVVVVALVGVLVVVRGRRARRGSGSPRVSEQRRRSTAVQQIWNIPVRAEFPVEREALLAELAATLHVGGPVWLRSQHDGAGVGVTTAMIDFAHRHRDRYDIAWWVRALDPDLVPDRLAELAGVLGLAAATDSADQATEALLAALSRRHRWLLIFDDAAGPRELAGYLPSGPGHVLVASSDSAWREQASPVTVSTFTREESVSLLRSALPDLTPEPADRIAAALADLPLAVGPAAATLADTDLDVDTFRTLPADAADAAAVWTVLLDRLAADDPPALALLTLVAWLGPAPVPFSLVTRHPDALPEPLAGAARRPSGLAEQAALLRRRGLARVTAGDLELHPVPAALLVERTGAAYPDDGGWTAIVVRLLRAATPDRPPDEPACWPTCRRLLPHVLAATDPARRLDIVADDVGWLLAQAGGYLAARGRTTAARALLEDAHEFDVSTRLRAFGESSARPER